MPGSPTRRLVLAGCLLLVVGCGAEPAKPDPEPIESPSPSPVTEPDPRLDAEAIVNDPDVMLVGVRLQRSGDRYDVSSLWRLPTGGQAVLASSDDGFATATFSAGGYNKLWRRVLPPRPAGAPEHLPCAQVSGGIDVCVDGYPERNFPVRWTDDHGATWTRRVAPAPRLLCGPHASLRSGTFAVVCGGDGATLLPFQLAIRSADLGETWQTFDLPLFDGERAYVSGSLVTADGRLLNLLDYFSDDKRHRVAPRHHGLYASDGADWSSLSPLRPRFSPALTPAPGGRSQMVSVGAVPEPEPLIYVQTWDHRVYVSTDDAATFAEIPVR